VSAKAQANLTKEISEQTLNIDTHTYAYAHIHANTAIYRVQRACMFMTHGWNCE